ncbi:hypothetical protein SBA3_3480012 [Candidatus Sulfopaludibacter sp. SbA3]|nr:hypothetical protein SBA3_3480012 [Candidatus Sulfopaludibacter sp. SbA3]
MRSLREYHGYLWVGTATGLWRWTPDPTRIYQGCGDGHRTRPGFTQSQIRWNACET